MKSIKTEWDCLELESEWQALKEAQPRLRIRDAATVLEVSEAQLVSLGVGQGGNTRLKAEFTGLLEGVAALGEVMALMRSGPVVHERHGVLRDMRLRGDTAMFMPSSVDCRLFIGRWAYAFAVNENDRLSLQFFDVHGTAAFKVYCTEKSDTEAYHALVAQFADPSAAIALTDVQPLSPTESLMVDKSRLLQDWAAMTDVHASRDVIKQHGGNAAGVYDALVPEFAKALPPSIIDTLLESLASLSHPFRLFVRGPAGVQGYEGPVKRLMATGPWFNVLDPEFNLHVQSGAISQAWAVQKPAAGTLVSSVNFANADGDEILILTDSRDRDQPDSRAWQSLMRSLLE